MLEIITLSCALVAISTLTLVGFEVWEKFKPKPSEKPSGLDSWSPLTLIDPDAFVDKLRHHKIKTKPAYPNEFWHDEAVDKLRFKTNPLLSPITKPRKKSKKTKKR